MKESSIFFEFVDLEQAITADAIQLAFDILLSANDHGWVLTQIHEAIPDGRPCGPYSEPVHQKSVVHLAVHQRTVGKE